MRARRPLLASSAVLCLLGLLSNMKGANGQGFEYGDPIDVREADGRRQTAIAREGRYDGTRKECGVGRKERTKPCSGANVDRLAD